MENNAGPKRINPSGKMFVGKAKGNIDQIIPYMIFALLIILVGIFQPSALSGSWFANKIDGTATLALASVGQALVMLIWGVDLSIAGIICMTNSLSALIMPNSVIGIIGTILLMCAIGLVAGAINGIIVVKAKIQGFIATLATWFVWWGVALWIMPTDGGKVPDKYADFMMYRIGGVIPMSVILLLLVAAMWFWMRRTRFGIAIFAIGKDPTSAYYSGINVDRVKISVYALSGLFAAIAGTYRTAYANSGSPTAGNSYVLLTCCAAVLGGVDAARGRGNLYGVIIGAFILQMLTDLLVFQGLSSYWTSMIQGALLISVVAVNSVIYINSKRRSLEV